MIGGVRLQEDLSRWWAKVRRKPDPLLMVGQERARRIGQQFLALDDVSFAVAQGGYSARPVRIRLSITWTS